MKNKILILPLIFSISALVGCVNSDISKSNSTDEPFEHTASTIESTKININETEINNVDELISTGVLINFTEEAIDSAGNKDAIFEDINGNEFVAIISENTIMPDEFVVGNTYNVIHSEIQTMSIPPQYPEVSEISAITDDLGDSLSNTTSEKTNSDEMIEIDELTSEEKESLESMD